ncbi:DUF5131 family protein [Candidatus Magnetobacterium casense]|uniref:DUF5131 family protein n=1 Tax=Candidatus Magnetobacterium casense TaxID=1455061 RepID=A0ABS6RXW4_9BACT|nr:DUF5131 family protein [Candidatus Magnetobacterium casensis]MBV6341479.1 DUF5131 family protein [Candidatus Magnetobacterium casensis]
MGELIARGMMQKSKIEWCDYTVNPVKGYCPMACPYCYARRMYDRFGWDKTIRYEQDAWYKPAHIDQLEAGKRIFVGSTFELFGDWVKPEWLDAIFYEVELHSDQAFIFLTKQPQNLQKWSPFLENCWVGVSVDGTDNAPLGRMLYTAFDRIQAKVKFVSFEPLLANTRLDKRDLSPDFADIQWAIIGAETGNRKGKPPLTEVHKWAKEIIAAADEAGIPVFLKDNLKWPVRRQEFPVTKCSDFG